MPVITVDAHIAATPAAVFDYMHDPSQRQVWDTTVESAALEGTAVAAGARLHLRGRRKAPSWVGEYRRVDRPKGSQLVLLSGAGMPFRRFTQTTTLKAERGGTALAYVVDYELPLPLRLIDVFTFRSRLGRAAQHAVARVEQHFA